MGNRLDRAHLPRKISLQENYLAAGHRKYVEMSPTFETP